MEILLIIGFICLFFGGLRVYSYDPPSGYNMGTGDAIWPIVVLLGGGILSLVLYLVYFVFSQG